MEVMKIAVSGSTGLIGSSLVPFLSGEGHDVLRLVRREAAVTGSEVYWNPAEAQIDLERFNDIDAVVHLGGENIATGRWSDAKKKRIRDSRIGSTRFMSETLAGLKNRPKVLIGASAIGFYGGRGDEILDESSQPGTCFLSETCKDWEAATAPAVEAGIRVVNLRIGVVMSPNGGALKPMLTPFKLGLGGPTGNGKQYFSWIAIDDVLRALLYCLTKGSISGPVNCVGPNSVTNRELTKTLGRVLKRPTPFKIPAFAIRLALGEMGEELLLESCRVVPKRLCDEGYEFLYPELEGALRHLLGRPNG